MEEECIIRFFRSELITLDDIMKRLLRPMCARLTCSPLLRIDGCHQPRTQLQKTESTIRRTSAFIPFTCERSLCWRGMDEKKAAEVVFVTAQHKDLLLRGVPRELQERGAQEISEAEKTQVRFAQFYSACAR